MRSMRNVLVLVGCLSLAAANGLGAQQRAESPLRMAPAPEARWSTLDAASAERPAPVLAAGGLGGAGVGVLAGGLVGGALGMALAGCDDQDGCLDTYAAWAFNGAVVGESVLLPLGVHLANRRQGRYAPSLLASAGLGAAGLAAFWTVQKQEGPDALMGATLVATPLLQLLSAVAIERATGRGR